MYAASVGTNRIRLKISGPRRSFRTLAEFGKWKDDVQASALQVDNGFVKPLPLEQAAPLLHSISPMSSHLAIAGGNLSLKDMPKDKLKSPRDTMLECTFPLETDILLRNSVTDFSNWSSFRLGKFYETVDVFSADVAYRHCGSEQEFALVTAGHYNSRKLKRTNIEKNVVLRSYVTSVGTSSLEVRTDALQSNEDGKLELLNVCHTVMVALDPTTGKSLGKVGRCIPPLKVETVDDQFRLELAQQHTDIRKYRASRTMQLKSDISQPPTWEEFQGLHELHQHRAINMGKGTCLPRISDFTFCSSTVIFPEQRNVHGKLFGGFVMEEAEKLAQYAATFFSKGRPFVPLGIDEAIFLQPIAIGDMVTFTARVVHSTSWACRVLVTVEVRDPANRDNVPLRSNRLLFVYGGSDLHDGIIPETYSEILVHMDAKRRYIVEGPSDEEVQQIVKECQHV